MRIFISNLYNGARNITVHEEGQDLVEYALVVALIALAATTGMGSLATAINDGFSTIGTTLTSNV